jgi:hypothetical protein
VVIAIVAALAMFGVVMVTVATTMQLQEAEAQGCVHQEAWRLTLQRDDASISSRKEWQQTKTETTTSPPIFLL